MATTRLVAGLALAGLIGFSSAAWCGNDTRSARSGPKDTSVAGTTQLQVVLPNIKDREEHDTLKNCRQQGLYSSHDVVGDPESCLMYRLSLPNGPSGVM